MTMIIFVSTISWIVHYFHMIGTDLQNDSLYILSGIFRVNYVTSKLISKRMTARKKARHVHLLS